LYVGRLVYICIHDDLVTNRDYCAYTRLDKQISSVVL